MLWKQKQITNNRLSKNNKGATLIEVIAVIAVLSVVAAAVAGFMITGAKMSVNVSGKAGASIKEQTAVEFINKTILKYGVDALELYPAEGEDQKALQITLSNGESAFICTQEGAVVYKIGESDRVTELCPGKIIFENTTTNTVIYYINGKKHVVHLRVAPQS